MLQKLRVANQQNKQFTQITTSNGQTHIKLVRLDQDASWRIGTPIITATLRINGKSISTPVQFNLPKVTSAIQMTFNKLLFFNNSTQFHFTDVLPVNRSEICSYLVYTEQDTIWSDSGCNERLAQDEGVYQCSCNHTTDFAVLLLVYTPSNDVRIFQGHVFDILKSCLVSLNFFTSAVVVFLGAERFNI